MAAQGRRKRLLPTPKKAAEAFAIEIKATPQPWWRNPPNKKINDLSTIQKQQVTATVKEFRLPQQRNLQRLKTMPYAF
jgi:hypothetical protein